MSLIGKLLLKFALLLFLLMSQQALAIMSCRDLLQSTATRPGQINGFSIPIKPKFSMNELIANRHRLKPGASKYLLAETGLFRLVIEDRILPGKTEAQIVVVKYSKEFENAKASDPRFDFENAPDTEVATIVRSLSAMRKVFEKYDLLQYFDVVLPLDYGIDYIVFPFIEGVGLGDLTLAELKSLNPPKKYSLTSTYALGPPTAEQNKSMAQLWSEQQTRIKFILSVLKKNGFKIQNSYSTKSWSGVKYLSSFDASSSEHTYGHAILGVIKQLPVGFAVRDDLIVTVDGRFVITDPY